MNNRAVIALSTMDLDRPASSPMTVQPFEHKMETAPRAQLMPVNAAPEKLSPREEAVRIARAKISRRRSLKKIAGSPFHTFADAEEACKAMRGHLEYVPKLPIYSENVEARVGSKMLRASEAEIADGVWEAA